MVPDTPSRTRRLLRRLLGERRAARRTGDSPGRREADRRPLRGWIPAVALGLAIALVDWGTKWAIASSMAEGAFREVVAGRIAFWHVRNPAMILGLWENLPLDWRKVLAVVAAVLGGLVLLQVVGRAHRLSRPGRGWAWLFVGLVLGGMLGNLGERVIHWGVTDFLSLRWGDYWLPPGNVADLALFLAIPVAIPVMVFELRGRARRGTSPRIRARPPRPQEAGG